MPERVDIEIAIPTHNCAPWLDHLIQSVLAQNVASSWRIVLRDDASTDPTPLRIEYWRTQLGPRLQLVENSGQQNLGMVGNYDAVLAATSARWVMFADPDDVWLPGKMDLSVRAMREAESKFGESVPLVV